MSDGGLIGLADYESDADAREAASQLLEYGIGCNVAPGVGDGSTVVEVLPGDVKRAKKHLGIAKDAPAVPTASPVPASGAKPDVGEAAGTGTETGTGTEPGIGTETGAASGPATPTGTESSDTDGEKVHRLLGGRIEATTRQIVVAGLIYLAALIIIPLIAFYGTRWAVGSGSDEPEPVPITIPE